MTRELITSWHEHDLAVERLFSIAQEKILIYGNQLTQLRLDSEAHATSLSVRRTRISSLAT